MMMTVELIGSDLVIMDSDGTVEDVIHVTSRRQAKRLVNLLTMEYCFNVADAMRTI